MKQVGDGYIVGRIDTDDVVGTVVTLLYGPVAHQGKVRIVAGIVNGTAYDVLEPRRFGRLVDILDHRSTDGIVVATRDIGGFEFADDHVDVGKVNSFAELRADVGDAVVGSRFGGNTFKDQLLGQGLGSKSSSVIVATNAGLDQKFGIQLCEISQFRGRQMVLTLVGFLLVSKIDYLLLDTCHSAFEQVGLVSNHFRETAAREEVDDVLVTGGSIIGNRNLRSSRGKESHGD